MWGFLAKAAGWAWAHKAEIGVAIQVWKRLRAKRKEDQWVEESAKDYYIRVGRGCVLERVAWDIQDEDYKAAGGDDTGDLFS